MSNKKKIPKYEKLKAEIEKAMNENEYRTSKIKGVSNLSRSDLDFVLFYADIHKKQDGYLGNSYTEPRGNVKELLDRFDIVFEKNMLF